MKWTAFRPVKPGRPRCTAYYTLLFFSYAHVFVRVNSVYQPHGNSSGWLRQPGALPLLRYCPAPEGHGYNMNIR